MIEIAKSFSFEAAHTLARHTPDAPASARIHGHSYRAEVVLRGQPGADGMLLDLAHLEAEMAAVRAELDHRLLDEIDGLGPATMENLARWIFGRLRALPLASVTVHRDSLHEWARCIPD